MEVKVCNVCGGLFQYVAGEVICMKCKQREDAIFQVVKEFLRENPGAKLPVVCENTGATAAQIKKFLKQGRLEAVEGTFIKCQRCGKEIPSGTVCKNCDDAVKKTVSDLKKSVAMDTKVEPAKQEKMRTYDFIFNKK